MVCACRVQLAFGKSAGAARRRRRRTRGRNGEGWRACWGGGNARWRVRAACLGRRAGAIQRLQVDERDWIEGPKAELFGLPRGHPPVVACLARGIVRTYQNNCAGTCRRSRQERFCAPLVVHGRRRLDDKRRRIISVGRGDDAICARVRRREDHPVGQAAGCANFAEHFRGGGVRGGVVVLVVQFHVDFNRAREGVSNGDALDEPEPPELNLEQRDCVGSVALRVAVYVQPVPLVVAQARL